MVEAALIIPTFFVILTGLFSLLGLINAYMSFNQAMRESLLAMPMVEHMEECLTTGGGACSYTNLQTSGVSFNDLAACSDGTYANAYKCGHIMAHWRFQQLLTSGGLDLSSIQFTTTYQSVGGQPTLTAVASATLNAPFSIYNGAALNVRGIVDYPENLNEL